MGKRRPGNKQKGKKEGKTTPDPNRWRSPRNSSRTSVESEPPQSPPIGRPPRKRSRTSSFYLGESSEENSVFCGRCQEKDKELALLLEELSIKDKIKEEYEEMKAKYEEEKRQKDEALTRLSAMASNKLRDNNPNIADLSDQNRPTKIAEKLSELYDNEWTDAFDALNDEMSETETIDFLLDILMRSYKACKAIASENYFEKVQRIIEFPVQGELSVTSSSVLPDEKKQSVLPDEKKQSVLPDELKQSELPDESMLSDVSVLPDESKQSVPPDGLKQSLLPDELKQQIKEFRKLRAVHVIEDVQKAIRSNQQSKFDSVEEVKTYKSMCEELCWLMAVQDPPLVLSENSPQKFDTNVFKDYTKRGTYVQYVVWPALFLNEGGSLLTKGVAQGCNNLPLDNDLLINTWIYRKYLTRNAMGNSWSKYWQRDDGPPPAKKRKLSDNISVPGGAYTEIFQEKDQEIKQLQSTIKWLEETHIPKNEYEEMRQNYQREKTAKDEALRRLSALASSKLRDNNPNIADLSDQNRPTKIAEKMSELYDNQWTDAFDALAGNMRETDIIKLLRDLLMGYTPVPPRATSMMPDSLKQQIKEFRKSRALHVTKEVEKAIQGRLHTSYNHYEAVRKYISSCVEVTWLMVVQDPPLVLSVPSSSKFDNNTFKDYTKRGPYMDSAYKEQFDLETDTLRIQAKIVNESAKVIHKEQKNIQRKKRKASSKKLPTCIDNYNNALLEIRESLQVIQTLIDTDDAGFAPPKQRAHKPRRVSSWNETKERKRKREEEPFRNIETDCLQCLSKSQQIQKLEAKLKRIQRENEDNLKQFIQSNEELRKQYEGEKESKEDVLRRLSSVASNKLRDNNPNISDLSDQNRPTKIAEKMSELYDNQWTDAFDALQGEMDEREIIRTLLDTMMAVYHECQRMSTENFFERVQRSIEVPAEVTGRSKTKLIMSNELKQQIKELRRSRATFVVKDIEKVVKPNIQLSKHQLKEIQEYISRCVEIGWLCAVQNPPLVLESQPPSKFNTSMFKDYTKSGKYVDYVVWPAMFLHEGGALLAKGIAQGTDHK
ncbi:uncharacterized protein LOC123558290 [Mercenaria mercenaria]|uniref:uncharacterized protein LOC123558290 n=1 Tax=Mercenaria mercenaria TaxID=6596 RepID=UPI00234F4368|nr:uncharacterized protein LOC123558290 [Mercenaria mercenaria]